MTKDSFFRNVILNIHYVICIFSLCYLYSCYSFTGGSIPEHLKTLYIANVVDNSGYGDPRYRESLMQTLVNDFRNDNSFTLVDRNGDAKLSVTIVSISDQTLTVKPGELEIERKVTVICEAEYYDAVKMKQIWQQKFTNFDVYEIADAQVERDKSIRRTLEQNAEDILLAVVSGW